MRQLQDHGLIASYGHEPLTRRMFEDMGRRPQVSAMSVGEHVLWPKLWQCVKIQTCSTLLGIIPIPRRCGNQTAWPMKRRGGTLTTAFSRPSAPSSSCVPAGCLLVPS